MNSNKNFELRPSLTAFELFAQDPSSCPPGEEDTVLNYEVAKDGIHFYADPENVKEIDNWIGSFPGETDQTP